MSEELSMKAQQYIDAVVEKDLLAITMPLKEFTQTAVNLSERGRRDSALLQKSNYDLEKLDLIPVLSQLLRQKNSDFFEIRFTTSQSRVDFLGMREKADYLIGECLYAFDAAFHDNETLMSKAGEIKLGSSHTDTIQDVIDCKTLAFSNRERLEKIGFDFSILDGADELAANMSSLLAKALADESESPEKRIARDKIYTALRLVLEELVRIGRYAARNTSNQDQYTLAYKPASVRKKKDVVTDNKKVTEEKAPVAV